MHIVRKGKGETMVLQGLAKRFCSGIVAGLTAISIMSSSLPNVTNSLNASAEGTITLPTANEFIDKASELLGAPYTYGAKGLSNAYGSNGGTGGTVYKASDIVNSRGIDCSGFVAWTLSSFGLSSSGYAWNCPVPIDTMHWLYTDVNCTKPVNLDSELTWKRTVGGSSSDSVTLNALKVKTWTPEYNGSGLKLNYWQKSETEDLPKGSVIIAEGYDENGSRHSESDHAWIYIGQYENRDAVINYLVNTCGVDSTTADRCVGDGTGAGGNHWRIEATTTKTHSGIEYTGVMIDNDVSGKSSGSYQITAYNMTTPELLLQKVNENGEPVAAVSQSDSLKDKQCTYGVYKSSEDAESDSNRVATVALDSTKGNGSLRVDYIPGGYYAKELTAPAGYKLSGDIIKLDYDNVNNLVDNSERGRVIINKTLADGKDGAVTFEIHGSDGSLNTSSLDTVNSEAQFIFDNLPVYTYAKTAEDVEYAVEPIAYTIKEVQVSTTDGTEYVKADDVQITLDKYYDEQLATYQYSTDIVNYPEKVEVLGEIDIVKTDADTSEPVEGAEFSIYPESEITFGNKVYSSEVPIVVLTDGEGKAKISGIPLGTYTIKETKAAVPYYFEENTEVVEITEDDYIEGSDYAVKSYATTNKKQKVNLSVYKTDSKTNRPISGVEFTISQGDTVIGKLTTDGNGFASSNGEFVLYANTVYTISETGVPSGYNDTNYSETFKGEYTDPNIEYQDLELHIENTPTAVTISKKSLTGDEELPGADMQVLDEDGNIVESWISGTEPHEIIGKLIPNKVYTLREVVAPDGYVVATDIPFSIDSLGVLTIDKVVVDAHDENGNPLIVMKDDTTKVKITKYDITTKEELPGAKLQVKDINNNIIEEWVSSDEPHYIEGKLKAGETYFLHEEIAPDGYTVGNDIEFKVSDDGQIDSVEMTNSESLGTVEVHKITDKMEKISGIKFNLSGKSILGKEIQLTQITGENGIAVFENIPVGSYTLTEVKESIPDGYIAVGETNVEVTLVSNGETKVIEMFNDTTKVKISKQDITNGEELAGATLQVLDKDGVTVEEWVSSNEPHMIEGKLRAGEEYTLRETIAPDGYKKATDIKFTVGTDGKVQTVIMKDELVPSTTTKSTTSTVAKTTTTKTVVKGASANAKASPKTGVNEPVGIVAILAIASIGVFVSYKRKEK